MQSVDENGNNDMKFSVLVPVYNAERYLAECIESVLSQTYPAYEIILVDDGSTDNSGAICDEYAKKYLHIKVFHKPNEGQLSARQFAVAVATGEYFLFLDSDDSLKPHTLQTVYSTIQQHACDCVIFDFERCKNGVALETGFDISQPDKVITDKRTLYRTVFLNQRLNSICRKVARASLFTGRDYSRFYSIKLGEDLLQSLEIMENSEKTVIIPHPLYNYRMNDASVTHSIRYETNHVVFTVEEQMLALLEKYGVFTETDYEELRDYRIKCFVDNFRMVSMFNTTFQQKKLIFQEMAESWYYKYFLFQGVSDVHRVGMKRYLFLFFKKGQYRLIVWCEKLYSFFRSIKRLARR